MILLGSSKTGMGLARPTSEPTKRGFGDLFGAFGPVERLRSVINVGVADHSASRRKASTLVDEDDDTVVGARGHGRDVPIDVQLIDGVDDAAEKHNMGYDSHNRRSSISSMSMTAHDRNAPM